MPFLRVEKKGDATYLRIVESYRDSEAKTRHRTLFSLGKVDDYSSESLRRIGKTLYELGGGMAEKIKKEKIDDQQSVIVNFVKHIL